MQLKTIVKVIIHVGHPGLNSYSKIEDHYHIQGLPNRFAGQGTKVYNPILKGKESFLVFLIAERQRTYRDMFHIPNVMLA